MLGLRPPGLNKFEYCVCRAVSSHSSHYPQDDLLAQFSLYGYNGNLKRHSFHSIFSTSRFVNVWSQIKHISVIFNHFRLWIAVARHNLKRLKIQIYYLSRIKVTNGLWSNSSWLNAEVNPLIAKLFDCNFHSLKVLSRWRDPQLQVSENCSDLTNGVPRFWNLVG